MAAKKLNQILAVEKTVKSKREDQFTKMYQAVQKPDLAYGFTRTFIPKTEDVDKQPTEQKQVQTNVEKLLAQAIDINKEIFNITAQKDATNCNAKANVVIDGETILKDVPATHLLWIEKRLGVLQKFISELPVLTTDQKWQYDPAISLFRSEAHEVLVTKKTQQWDIIVPATKEHPAQTKERVSDVTIGTRETVHYSGAIPEERKQTLLGRVEKFLKAVKEAREEANQTAVVDLVTGTIVERIFAL